MTIGTWAIIATIVLAVIAYVIQFFTSLWKNKETTTKIITDLKFGLIKELNGMSSIMTTETAVIKKQIEYLEKKQDKHNNMIERVYKSESSVASSHHRLDGIDLSISHIEDSMKKIEIKFAEQKSEENKKGEK